MEMNDGTGMGEGQGFQNVSDQIQHEEQLEGLQDEQGDPDEDKDKEEKGDNKKDDNAFDMKNDFDGQNEEKEQEEEDKDEVDSNDLDDEMDDVDNQLDNELFNEDNEIDEESDQQEEEEEKANKPPVDLNEQADAEKQETEAKGNDENKQQDDKDQKQDKKDQKESELKPENEDEVNEEQKDQEQPFINKDERVKEEEDEEKDAEEEPDDQADQNDEADDDQDMSSQEGEHKFDPDRDEGEGNAQEDQEQQDQNDFDIDDLENMDDDNQDADVDGDRVDDEEDKNDSDDNSNPDMDPDVDAAPDKNQNMDDKNLTSQLQTQNDQKQNTTGTNIEQGQRPEEQEDTENQPNPEEKDYNAEDNDYLFQVMQQCMDRQDHTDKNKPEEGERNQDQSLKKADNIEEVDNLPEEVENKDDQPEEGKDFAKDDKSKELRSSVADHVKYNDQEMEVDEGEQDQNDDAEENPAPDDQQDMSEDEQDKKLEEVKDNDPVKSLMKTNEFYQKYLEDKQKNKETEEDKGQNEDASGDQDDQGDIEGIKDVDMQEEDDHEALEIKQTEAYVNTTDFDVLDMKQQMMARYEVWRKDKRLVSSSYELLNKFKKATQNLSISLCEQMRMILEPTEKSRLKGDFKSGKRINIKKIIPFIASNYRNDKIWLRREMPFKRDYRVVIAIDDSLSMKQNNLGFFALESLVSISEALNQLSVGKVCVCGINDRMNMHMSFEDTYTSEKAAFMLSNYSFEYQSARSADTSIPNFMADCNKLMDNLHTENRNIVFIISDGRFNKKKVTPHIMEAEDKNYLYVFILLDNHSIDSKNSIFNIKSAELVKDENGNTDYQIKRYLDNFPFKYYTVVQDITHLPKVLSNIFLQWLSLVNSA